MMDIVVSFNVSLASKGSILKKLHSDLNCVVHCRKQVALSALTCRFSPFALWDLADFG